MPAVERLCCFDDGRGGTISPRFPLGSVDSRAFDSAQHDLDRTSKQLPVGSDRQKETVLMGYCLEDRRRVDCTSRDEDWSYDALVAGLVKVLQVQCVIHDLV